MSITDEPAPDEETPTQSEAAVPRPESADASAPEREPPAETGAPTRPEDRGGTSEGGEEPPPTRPVPPADPFDGLLLDADFIAGAGAKEHSARTRMLAARWKERPPEPVPWRAAPAPVRRLRLRRGPARPGAPVVRRRSRVWATLLPWQVLTAVVLVLAMLNPGAVRGLFTGARAGGGGAAPTVPFREPTQSAAPFPDPDLPTLQHPFAGSPAAGWSSGAGAIELPAARVYGHVSKERVSAALGRIKSFLIDTNLDPAVLAGGTPSAALSLLDPHEKEPGGVPLAAEIRRELAHPTSRSDPTDVVSRFDPGQARLDGTVVKVKGRMTLSSDSAGGTLVTADYTFVYPLRSGTGPGAETARTIVRRVEEFDVVDTARYLVSPGTLILKRFESYNADGGCGERPGFLVPEFPTAEQTGPTPSGAPVDPYDLSKPLPTGSGCGLASRI